MVNQLSYIKERGEMLEIVHHMFDRKLTNAAGGNIAVQVDEGKLLVSPSMMSEYHRCNIAAEDFLLIDFEKNILEGEGIISRESDMHIGLIKNFPYIRSCIHAHPQWCMVYAAQGKAVPSVTEATMKKGDAGAIPYTRAYTPELAQNIYRYFDGMREKAEQMPLGVVIPKHGVICTGSNLTTAYNMLERMETDAMCSILGKLI